MKEVIIGTDGFIGRRLATHLPEATGTTRRPQNPGFFFDIGRRDCPLPDADVVYICAGINGTLTCARDPQRSFRTNVDGTLYVAEQYRAGGFVVWISSTTVEWCQDHYGQQKRIAETALRTMPHVGIVRAGRVTPDNLDDLCVTMIRIGRSRSRGVTIWGEEEQPYAR